VVDTSNVHVIGVVVDDVVGDGDVFEKSST